jgi:hypothetical protein
MRFRNMSRWLVVATLGLLGCGGGTVVVRNAPPCPGGVWIVGHYGPAGYWHTGHWRCPGVVEVAD